MECLSHKRIVILESDQLLFAGMQSLLSEHGKYEVIGLELVDEQHIYREIERLHPEVVILNENLQGTDLGKLLNYLASLPEIRTILVNTLDNRIQIMDKHQSVIRQLSDFLAYL